jgi:HSP20 family protein
MDDMTLLFEPFAPLFELSREFDRLAPGGTRFRSFVPAADVVVTDEAVTVVMDVPGLASGDLDVELVDDVLTIRGERAFPYETGTGDQRVWQRLERGFGKFERVLRVPQGLDVDSIQAELADGVLTLHIPVVSPKPKRIEITPGNGSQATLEQGTTAPEAQSEDREMAGATA